MPQSPYKAHDEEGDDSEHGIAEDVGVALEDSFDQRIVDRDGQEDYPAVAPAAADVEAAEQYVGDGGEDGVGDEQPEAALALVLTSGDILALMDMTVLVGIDLLLAVLVNRDAVLAVDVHAGAVLVDDVDAVKAYVHLLALVVDVDAAARVIEVISLRARLSVILLRLGRVLLLRVRSLLGFGRGGLLLALEQLVEGQSVYIGKLDEVIGVGRRLRALPLGYRLTRYADLLCKVLLREAHALSVLI